MGVFQGGCQCGAVRYAVNARRLIVYACHCLECQKQTASAFALSIPVPAKDFEITGPVAIYRRPTDSGSHTNCHFCKVCGTRLYHQSERSRDMITIKGGTLDDTSSLVPVAHLWTQRKQPWLTLPDGSLQFETQPDDLKAWRDGLVAAAT